MPPPLPVLVVSAQVDLPSASAPLDCTTGRLGPFGLSLIAGACFLISEIRVRRRRGLRAATRLPCDKGGPWRPTLQARTITKKK